MIFKLSIITVCFNEKETILNTIESVIAQTFNDYEWIVIDGGSTDGTLDILSRYKQHFSYFVSEADTGIYNAMNKGLKFAKGEYIHFLNGGDCYYNDSVLKKIANYIGIADILHGSMIAYENGNNRIIRDPDPVTKKYMLKCTIKHPASFVRKTLFNEIGGFNESFKIAGDYDFFLRAILKQNASTKYIDEIITVFDLNGIARNNPDIRGTEQILARKKNINFYTKHSLTVAEYFKFKLNEIKRIF